MGAAKRQLKPGDCLQAKSRWIVTRSLAVCEILTSLLQHGANRGRWHWGAFNFPAIGPETHTRAF